MNEEHVKTADSQVVSASETVPAPAGKKGSEDYFADFDLGNLEVSMEAMLKNGVHFGHRKARKNPKMEEYIFSTRNGVSIIDLQKTVEKVEEAAKFLKQVKKEGKQILFVGTKKQIKDLVRSAAVRVGMPFVCERWLGGTFTNFPVIKGRAQYLKKGQEEYQQGKYSVYTKFERTKKAEELEKLEVKLGGIKDMLVFPGAVIVTDAKENLSAIREARIKQIPIVAITDTNTDPMLVDYPIPANDDAISAVRYILGCLAKAISEESVAAVDKDNIVK